MFFSPYVHKYAKFVGVYANGPSLVLINKQVSQLQALLGGGALQSRDPSTSLVGSLR